MSDERVVTDVAGELRMYRLMLKEGAPKGQIIEYIDGWLASLSTESPREPTNDQLARWLILHTGDRLVTAVPRPHSSHPWYALAAARVARNSGEPVAWEVTYRPRIGGGRVVRLDFEPDEDVDDARKILSRRALVYAAPPEPTEDDDG